MQWVATQQLPGMRNSKVCHAKGQVCHRLQCAIVRRMTPFALSTLGVSRVSLLKPALALATGIVISRNCILAETGKLKDTALLSKTFLMNICYLDYDAVLHDGNVLRNRSRGMYLSTPGRIFFEWMPILDALLLPYPEVKIVLSTTWVRELGFDKAKHELSAAARDRVIGATFLHPKIIKSEFDMQSRGMQILGDVQRRKPTQWFALDDDAFGWPAAHQVNLIQTQDQSGLSDPGVQELVRQKLLQMHGGGKRS